MLNKYLELSKQLEEKNKRLKNRYNKISTLRLISAAAAVISVSISRKLPFIIMMAAAVLFFLWLVKKHSDVEDETKFTRAQQDVVKFYLNREEKLWINEELNNEEYDSENYYAGKDLDIFGRASLYKYLCGSGSSEGRKKLAERLINGCENVDKIYFEQEAVKEISEKSDFRTEFQTYASFLNSSEKNSSEKLKNTVSKPVNDINIILKSLSFIVPAAVFIMIALMLTRISFVLLLSGTLLFMALCFVLSSFANAFCQGIIKKIQQTNNYVVSYSKIISLIQNENFKSDKLSQLKQKLESTDALNQINALVRISELSEMRSNMLAFLILNSFVMWDVHCISRFCKWNKRNNQNISVWIDIISEFEVTACLSVLPVVNPDCVYPEMSQSNKPFVRFTNLRHPLIDRKSVVGNSSDISNDTLIITGSNMSGKTTFMRSVGIGLILAKAGAPVTADSFSACYMTVMTSIRTQDSVADGISTFYAELLRIKQMVDFVKKGSPVIVLIDEIFKGTNSKDRIVCAQETIKRLSKNNSIVMVTTHDFELCSSDFESREPVNKHFSEYYEDNKIKFDYKIMDGRCTTTNAQQLLKMVGITTD